MTNIDFIKRRAAFSKGMDDASFALFYAGKAPHKTNDQKYAFTINKNFYYLTGLIKEYFILLILKNGDNHFEYLFIEEPSDYATKWLGGRMTKEEASEISGIASENILYLNQFDAFVANRVLLDSRQALAKIPERLYLDLFKEKLMEKPFVLELFKKIIDTYPELTIKNLTPIMDEMRRLKTSAEIEEMQKAIDFTEKGIQALMNAVKPGMNERNIEALFEYVIKAEGSEGVSFNTIAASGKNATVLHYEDNNCVIEDGSLLLCDLGALSNEYAADITRTFPANGKFTERQKEFYQLVLDVNKAIISMIKPGVMLSELNSKAYDLLAEGMIKLKKIKEKSELVKYYYHGVGHYLGIDVHDVGTYSKPIEPGVVVTVEPGIYVGEEKIGIRIEDDILVTKEGNTNLSKNIIKEINEIEAYMKK